MPGLVYQRAKRSIIAAFSLSILVSVGLVVFFLDNRLGNVVYTQWKKHAGHFALSLSSQWDLAFDRTVAELEQVAQLPQFGTYEHGNESAEETDKREILETFTSGSPYISTLFIASPEGSLYMVYPRAVRREMQRHDFSGRDYFQEASRNGEPVISDGLLGADGEEAVVIDVPVTRDGEIIAHLCAVLYIDTLSGILNEQRVGEFNTAYIVDSAGKVVAHSDPERLEEQGRGMYVNQAPVSTFVKQGQRGSEPVRQDTGDPSVRERAVRYVESGSRLTAFVPLEMGWGLGLSRSTLSLQEEIDQTIARSTLFVGVLLLLIGALGMFWVIRGTARWAHAERRLRETNRELEERVAERTRNLERKNSEMERFIYTVSHDLRSPLITIKGFIGMLRKDLESAQKERIESDVNRINNAAVKMQGLLDDLLQLSRIGRIANPSEQVDMTALAGEVVELLRGSIDVRGVEVHIEEGMTRVYGDRQRLMEVLQNLVENSIKFLGQVQHPQIRIGQSSRSDPAGNQNPVFYVQDNGAGIDPRYTEKIFNLFDKLDQDTEGSGVGLSLVRRIVEYHGGSIWAESEGIGEGTTFYFSLSTDKEGIERNE